MSTTETADRVADAAREILAAEGSRAVTMRRVAEAAGITAMAIYKHYPSREALLGEVADRAFRDLGRTWGRRDTAGDWQSRALGLLDDFLDFALGSPHLYAFLMTERRERARRFPEGFRESGSPAYSRVVAAVEEGMAAGLLRRDDPLEVALALTAPVQGLVQLYLGGRMGLPEAEFRALCHRTAGRVLDGIRA
ncbi:TetR/AcrR family transcriptional regulator [Bailinhaonella thermotolerans]|uniref:TetR/AcrR family transcriptional regulator n=1 Tax=Bailinhaonella thermotolerans TaxID=1070861 RepID=A0A3A4B465_9ACTN|nr:TetR/AcrR family transcriptional regulator [Bailinhaonella thermotolerans]RJL35360.1 TetR/AcrR family transcriptional regulator [Bailinhaonella thermotolerans]